MGTRRENRERRVKADASHDEDVPEKAMMKEWAIGESLFQVSPRRCQHQGRGTSPPAVFGILPYQRETSVDLVFNLLLLCSLFHQGKRDILYLSVASSLRILSSPNTSIYRVAPEQISHPTEPPSWPRSPMFATCWICPQKGSPDHIRSKRWWKSDQVCSIHTARNGMND